MRAPADVLNRPGEVGQQSRDTAAPMRRPSSSLPWRDHGYREISPDVPRNCGRLGTIGHYKLHALILLHEQLANTANGGGNDRKVSSTHTVGGLGDPWGGTASGLRLRYLCGRVGALLRWSSIWLQRLSSLWKLWLSSL